MEVDMQSPPTTFRASFSLKRPRSPGSPTQERQTKRLSLAPLGVEAVRRASTAGVADGPEGRIGQEDWVRQAMELTIASPLTAVTAGIENPRDECMAVDDEEAHAQLGRVHVPGSARWTRSHLPLIYISTTTPAVQTTVAGAGVGAGPSTLHVPSPAPLSVLTEPPSSSSDEASSEVSCVSAVAAAAGHAQLRPPDIFLLPATPEDAGRAHPFAGECAPERGERLSQSVLARQIQERVHGSPRPRSSGPDAPTSSGRKHRVTMGPRADCVKCRTGVRGHWMHFD